MAGHSRSKNGVASLAYVPAISIRIAKQCHVYRDGRDKPGHDGFDLLLQKLKTTDITD
ncbi:MAG TPA: hypothetical protein VGL62_16240 [Vicinamibacterales bacterium]